MKSILLIASLTLSATFASAKDYQVTGAVTEVTDTKIVVDKKGEKFEIAKSPTVKTSGPAVAVGSKVTVYYSMTATEIESKGAATEKKKAKK